MSSNLVIVCVHVLNGQSVYHQTEGHILCKECFEHYNSYGHDENGHWKIPKNENLSNLRSVCRSCVNQIVEDRCLFQK
jgi:hypothetical protein